MRMERSFSNNITARPATADADGCILQPNRSKNAPGQRGKEMPMNSKRRRFLKGGAALAGLAAGGAKLAKGQTQGTPEKKVDELIAYGDRSRFVKSIRVPVAERHSPD